MFKWVRLFIPQTWIWKWKLSKLLSSGLVKWAVLLSPVMVLLWMRPGGEFISQSLQSGLPRSLSPHLFCCSVLRPLRTANTLAPSTSIFPPLLWRARGVFGPLRVVFPLRILSQWSKIVGHHRRLSLERRGVGPGATDAPAASGLGSC